jgi:membrane protein YqaA with SNARE-associated domain
MALIKQGDKLLERLSKTKYLFSFTFVVAFLEASISPLLPEAFLLIVLAYRKDVSWKLLSCMSAFGSASGAVLMYVVGYFLYASYGTHILSLLHGEALVEHARVLFVNNSFMAQFVASLTPLPDRVFSFLAGAFKISLGTIFVATFFGRLIRVLPVAYLSYEYGDEAREYSKRHTKKAVIALVCLVTLYCIYSYYK